MEPQGGQLRLPPSIEVVARRPFAATAAPAGFLVSFNADRPEPSSPGGPPLVQDAQLDGLFLLRNGLNRVGFDPNFCDFERPSFRAVESRQWLIVVVDGQAFVADDRSTNQSFVLPASAPRIEGHDPRFETGCSGFGQKAEGMIALDWEGSRVAELHEGDVLITCYAAFVFGWVQPARREHG